MKRTEGDARPIAMLGIATRIDGTSLKSTQDLFSQSGLNTGNFAFQYAVDQILGGNRIVYPWTESIARLNALNKLLVFPCANILGPHADFGGLGDHFAQLRIPIIAIGMGAQGRTDYGEIPDIPAGTLRLVNAIATHSPNGNPNIGVRGPFTLATLAKYGLAERAIVTGCPSLFINPAANLGELIAARAERPWTRVAVAAGHPGWTHLGRIEASLAEIVEATGGEYIVQSPLEMVVIARGQSDTLPRDVLTRCRDYTCPAMSLEDFARWARRHFKVYFGVSEWMEALFAHDFVVGARIHGVMLALQAGVPGLCIAHDSRTRELCEVMGVPWISASKIIKGTTLDDLRANFAFDGAKFDANRRALAKNLAQFLSSNGIGRSDLLSAIIGKD